MPKVSQQQAQLTRQRIIDCALEILLSQGVSALTFTNLANKAAIGRSSINAHFKKKDDLLAELRPQISIIIRDALCFDNPDVFYDSWVSAIKSNHQFRQAIDNAKWFVDTDTGIERLIASFKSGTREEIEKTIYTAMGYALVNLPKYQSISAPTEEL
ncbi:TetR family transcriptional regulator [Psychrobium sp. MM17-31]|uniref:TetR family transcriptional regulator n=1 Tax=Psychrobium sp. MM17-31 TaxID=2917758 RepID=UPI001EF55065|nr:TetR family transcriptional regulator [Psychrobium sp. MM17-31]MCG7530677.1 TetR family transcriptional regulator [Psychrobium sp. MM17-31]